MKVAKEEDRITDYSSEDEQEEDQQHQALEETHGNSFDSYALGHDDPIHDIEPPLQKLNLLSDNKKIPRNPMLLESTKIAPKPNDFPYQTIICHSEYVFIRNAKTPSFL